MSLSDHIPSGKRTFEGPQITTILWLAGVGFSGAVLALLLLQRLGLPMPHVLGITLSWTLFGVLALSWISRTMTSSAFFFAGRIIPPSPIGIAGTTDWMSGTFIVLFLSVPLTDQLIIAPALVLGLLLQATLFAGVFQRSGVSTLPGFFAWRGQSQLPGYVVLLVVSAILVALGLAELQTAKTILEHLTGFSTNTTGILLIILAILPGLCGGWRALLLINAALVTWLVITMLTPAIITGFVPDILRSSLELDRAETTLAALEFQNMGLAGGLDTNQSAPWLLATLFVFAAGFSVMPHALSRLSLNARPLASVESLGWTALVIFLILSALPLSIGLIKSNPTSATLSVLLEGQPVLQMLPYLAILFASYNALSVTLFAVSGAVVRALRRYRNLDPGEQSIFSTRLLLLILAVALFWTLSEPLPAPVSLFVWAVVLGAGGLFFPLVANIWLSSIPQLAISLAVLAGVSVTCYGLSPWSPQQFTNPIFCGVVGSAASVVILVSGRLVSMLRPQKFPDKRLRQLRNPEFQK